VNISRRAFLGTSAVATGGALVIGFTLRGRFHFGKVQTAENPFDAWIHINPDSSARLVLAQSEMGQGVYTSLPMILADEADLDWERVQIVQSDSSRGTGGSGSVRRNFLPLRRAGAVVRTALVAAAARKWGVAEAECATNKSAVLHSATGRRLMYGEIVQDALRAPLPDAITVRLKDSTRFALIGHETQHLDIPDKCRGTARFGLDVRLPGMVFAMVARCPVFGGSPARFDSTRALAIPGVLQVFEIPARGTGVFSAGGVAVVAKSTWAAMQGRKALNIAWNPGPNRNESSDTIRALMREALSKPAAWSSNNHGPDPNTANAAAHVESVYEFPFLAHACMEPMNVTLHFHDGRCEAWCPSQSGDLSRSSIAKELGISESDVTVHTTFMGGGFGRRYSSDFQTEAAQIARRVPSPVQLVWTREDDMTHDFYRTAGMRRMRGTVDGEGNVTAWSDHLADLPIDAQWHPPYKPSGSEMQASIVYPVTNFQIGFTPVQSAVPRAWWRSVSHSFHGVAIECFTDELAHAANMDPYLFRRRLLLQPTAPEQGSSEDPPPDKSRLVAVLDLAAKKSEWGKPLGPNRGRGIACTAAYAYLAQVAEVTIQHQNIRVDRLITVVDCGQVINPNGARHQIEGGMLFTLSSVLKEAITIRNGAVEQQNFDDYSVLRMPETPSLETYFIESHDEPHGLGEAAVFVTGPAIANAIFSATGKRLRRMPFRMDESQT